LKNFDKEIRFLRMKLFNLWMKAGSEVLKGIKGKMNSLFNRNSKINFLSSEKINRK